MPRTGWTYRDSFWALLVLAAVLVWMPMSVVNEGKDRGGSRMTIQIGMLRPLTAVWETWNEGVQLRIAEARTLALIGSAALTFAAVYAARRVYLFNQSRSPETATG